MATPPRLSPLLLLLLLLLRPAVGEAATDCAPPPALLLVSQVTELARTALTADNSYQYREGGPAQTIGSQGTLASQTHESGSQQTPDRPSPASVSQGPASGSQGHVLDRLQELERTVQQLTATVSSLTGGGGGSGEADPAQPGTCLQLQRTNSSLPDGVYQLAALDDPVYCDFSHDGGGWTLLLTAASRDGWDRLNVRLRNAGQPSLTDNYSILGRGDVLKELGTGRRFAYRLEGQAQVNRRQWGGIWLAPRDYTFTPETDTQRDIALVKKFNKWTYGKPSLQKTMPWINVEEYLKGMPLLTTALKSVKDWWGTLITDPTTTSYHHSPWIQAGAPQSGNILYWMREEVLP